MKLNGIPTGAASWLFTGAAEELNLIQIQLTGRAGLGLEITRFQVQCPIYSARLPPEIVDITSHLIMDKIALINWYKGRLKVFKIVEENNVQGFSALRLMSISFISLNFFSLFLVCFLVLLCRHTVLILWLPGIGCNPKRLGTSIASPTSDIISFLSR